MYYTILVEGAFTARSVWILNMGSGNQGFHTDASGFHKGNLTFLHSYMFYTWGFVYFIWTKEVLVLLKKS